MDIAKTVRLEPGHYVVAVSGGVDSMVLLDILAKLHAHKGSPVKLTVAHFDHGIRDVSHFDRLLVHEIADKHNLPFVYEEGNLDSKASEAEAREARYNFLRKVKHHAGARGIITAHHLDDATETAVMNLMRGTGRKGMASLRKRHQDLHRPLLHVPKHTLRSYAEANGLMWHEDSTNQNQDYRRNYVRHTILPKIKTKSPQDFHRLMALIRRQRELNHAIDEQLASLLHIQPSRQSLRRRDVVMLPYKVACELVAEWLRENGKRQLSRWLVERLTIAIRTAQPNTQLLIDGSSKIAFTKSTAEFKTV